MLPSLIQQKSCSTEPLRPTLRQISQIYTPVDEFPYQSFFRGRVSLTPTVFDRAAGWAPQYVTEDIIVDNYYPNHCWQAPCNTVYTMEKKDNKCVIKPCITLYR